MTLTGFGLLGYLLNDWADIPFDRKVGKANLVEKIPPVVRPSLLAALLAITIFPWFVYFKVDALSLGLILLQLILQISYPTPPVRLKRIPLVAMVVDAMYAFAVPAVLAWHTFDITEELNENHGHIVHFVFLSVWMLAMGLRHIINHHVDDRENDIRTGTANLAINVSVKRLRWVVQCWLFPLELTGALFFFGSLMAYSGFLPLLGVLLFVVAGSRHLGASGPFFNVSFSKTWLDRAASFWLGFLSLLILCVIDWYYLSILVVFLVLFTNIFSHPLVIWKLERFVKWPIEQASLMFNWSIYYFRKWFLRWSEERNWGGHYEKRLKLLADKKKSEKGIVAVFNQNHSKYTETFVSGHLKELPFKVLFFHGWPSPVHFEDMESLISPNGFMRKTLRHVWSILDLNKVEIEDARIVDKLIAERADVLLAEFGTMGARCVNISKKAGIPLVPIFYGYDAWHSKTLDEYKVDYLQMFSISPLIFGVSKDICAQLVALGCAENKVRYLPCYVNLDRFAFSERSFAEPRFLSVGRFCQTKAPFITIMAFKQVVEQIPEAKLTMIGNDDGGVLETVSSIIKAYNLENNVELLSSCTSDEVRDKMYDSSIYVQHSITTPFTGDKEGTPVAIMEAMATGMPVISTRHAGIAEMITHGETGILVNEFDYIGMANEMIGLVGDKERMKTMGMAASESIRSNKLVKEHMTILSDELARYIER